LSDIRVTYSGLISFGVGISTIFTSLVFTLIVTRQLTPGEFGTWSLIGALIGYVLVVEPIISEWVIRETARGEKSGKTAVVSTGFFSIAAIGIYIIIAFFVGGQSDAEYEILFFAGMLIPPMFLSQVLTTINYGWKPHRASYGNFVLQFSKIPVALIFVYFLDMGLVGTIIAVTIAYVVSDIVLFIFAKDKIKNKFNTKFLKKWLKLSWLPAYMEIPSMLVLLDVILFSIITSSVAALAFYAAAVAISKSVLHTGQIARAIYPKLLEGGKQEYLQENLIRFFYFALPLTALSISFARPGLFALNPLYDVAVPIVIFLSLRGFLSILSSNFNSALKAIEKVDIGDESTFKDFVKSKLFLLPTINIIHSGIYVVVLAVGFILLQSLSVKSIDLVIYWSIVMFVIEIPFTIYFYRLTKKYFTLKISFPSFFKYLFVSMGVFGFVYILMERFLEYKIEIFEFMPQVLLFGAIAIGAYLGITYVIDNRTRVLFKGIINEITKGKN
jgi:hypothetical protein